MPSKTALAMLLGLAVWVAAPAAAAAEEGSDPGLKERLINALPAPLSDGLEFDAWLWVGYLRNDERKDNNITDAVFSLDFTKSFGKRLAVSFEGNWVDANGDTRLELEQAFASILAIEQSQTLVTVGKFNANFGVEARDFWNRTTGTTSLLFGAQPQDLVGVMITQPIGKTGVKLRPFISADFQGFDFNQSPSAGLLVEYSPHRDWNFAVTNWVGPGFVLYGGDPLREPYKKGGYGSSGANVIANWQGPNFTAERGSSLYFLDARAIWHARRDLTLSAEYLMGTTDASYGVWGWAGFMALANFDLTEHWSLFARYSYLDDSDWLVTGEFQRVQEVSGGVTYRFSDKFELRGEYRHDHSNVTGDVNSVSIHLSVGL